jgi:hypothetical protein
MSLVERLDALWLTLPLKALSESLQTAASTPRSCLSGHLLDETVQNCDHLFEIRAPLGIWIPAFSHNLLQRLR